MQVTAILQIFSFHFGTGLWFSMVLCWCGSNRSQNSVVHLAHNRADFRCKRLSFCEIYFWIVCFLFYFSFVSNRRQIVGAWAWAVLLVCVCIWIFGLWLCVYVYQLTAIIPGQCTQIFNCVGLILITNAHLTTNEKKRNHWMPCNESRREKNWIGTSSVNMPTTDSTVQKEIKCFKAFNLRNGVCEGERGTEIFTQN